MNPQEFSWKEDQQVTVTNPTAETYKFKVHNKDYSVDAGRTVKMPGYIAWVYVYGLATQLAQADGKFMRWNEEGFRQEYYDKLVSGVDAVLQNVITEEPNPIVPIDEPSASDDEEEGEAEESPKPQADIAPMKAKVSDKSTSRA